MSLGKNGLNRNRNRVGKPPSPAPNNRKGIVIQKYWARNTIRPSTVSFAPHTEQRQTFFLFQDSVYLSSRARQRKKGYA